MANETKSAPEIDKATGAVLQAPQDITDAAKAGAESAKAAARPIAAGTHVVAKHNHVHSGGQFFKPGDAFTGAVGDIAALLKSGAIEAVGE